MMKQVNEFEGKELEIERLRRLIYELNQDVKESESVYYHLENVHNPQEISLRHLHNILNGFRYLNTINLTPFKYAEHARAIEIADRIESSLDALLKCEIITDEKDEQIVAALNDLKFENSSRSLQGTKSRLEKKVRLLIQGSEYTSEIDASTLARLKPGFFERLIKNIIRYVDSKRTKGPKEIDIYHKTDSIKDSYEKYKKEKTEEARLLAEKDTADAAHKASATEDIKTAVKESIVNAKKGLHALGEALHLISPTPSTEKSEQLKALHEMAQENRDISQSIPKQLAKKKQSNIDKAQRLAERERLKEEQKRKKETQQKLKDFDKEVKAERKAKKEAARIEIELIPAKPTHPKQEQLMKHQEMGELKDIIPANLVKEKEDKIAVKRENVEQQAKEESRKQREVELKLKEQDQQMKAEAKKKKQEQLIRLKEMHVIKAESVVNIESTTISRTIDSPSASEAPKDKSDEGEELKLETLAEMKGSSKAKSKPRLQKSPGTRDLKQNDLKPNLQKSPRTADLNKIGLEPIIKRSETTTVSEKQASFFTEGEKTKAAKTKASKKGTKKDKGFK